MNSKSFVYVALPYHQIKLVVGIVCLCVEALYIYRTPPEIRYITKLLKDCTKVYQFNRWMKDSNVINFRYVDIKLSRQQQQQQQR